MTASILVYNFYPVTAIMIVLLALMNDGAILSIAYDRTIPSKRPETWTMPVVLGLASILGIIGITATLGLLFLGERWMGLDRNSLQTLIYLKLSIAGHLTVFVTRTKGPFWSIKPARLLLGAVVGTQILATIFAVAGIFMTALDWRLACFVWIYSLIWFLVEDWAKQKAHAIFNHRQAVHRSRGLLRLNRWFSRMPFA